MQTFAKSGRFGSTRMLFSRVFPTSEDVLFDTLLIDVAFFESEFEPLELVEHGSAELEPFESFEFNKFESLLTLFSVERDFP